MSTATNPLARLRAPRALAEVLGTPGRTAGFLVSSGVVAFFYTLLLPFGYTQRFELANWGYLDAYLLAWAVVLGLAMGLVLSVQAYAMRRVAAARAASGAAGGVAFVASLLPSFLCCTPVIPSLLAFVGVSGVGLYTTTGALQHFFAVHQSEFLAASLLLLASCAGGGCARWQARSASSTTAAQWGRRRMKCQAWSPPAAATSSPLGRERPGPARRGRPAAQPRPEGPGTDKEPFGEQGTDAPATAASDRRRPAPG